MPTALQRDIRLSWFPKGYNLIKGLNFFDTFSLVEKITIVRTLLTIVGIHKLFFMLMVVNYFMTLEPIEG